MPKRNGSGIELLADPTRRRIVALLALNHRRPSTLAKEIGLSRPATGRQLRLFREAGLVSA
jgi:DNA-binding transcriptional ArsR family regulator